MDVIGEEGLLLCSSGEGLEPVLGTVLKKMRGKLEGKKKKARRKKEIGGKQYCLEAKNIKYWEDGVHLLCFFLRREKVKYGTEALRPC